MAPEIIIKAQPEHLAAIMQIEKACFGPDAFNIRQMRYLIHSGNPFFVVFYHEILAGYAVTLIRKNSKIIRLYALAVHPEYQGKGLANKLLLNSIELSQKMNMKQINLEVRTDNEAAINLYERKGFQVTERLPEYYKDRADGFKMKLLLAELK
jgi:ribosomal-protein-alanine acetyltransferase